MATDSREAEIAALESCIKGAEFFSEDPDRDVKVKLGNLRYLLAQLQQARQIEAQLNEAIEGERRMRSEVAAALQQAREALEARQAQLLKEHGGNCGDHEGLTYQYDMEAAAALHEIGLAIAALKAVR